MCECICVFASTLVISLGQVSVCLPVSLYEVSVCPRNAPRPICHWLLLFISSNWCFEVELCCALASEKYVYFFSLFCSVYLHMFLDENVTWWKSIKYGKCIRNENERSPDLHRAKVESELLNIMIKLNVTNFREFTNILMKARVWAWLLLHICNYMERSCFGPGSVGIENYTSRHSSIMHHANWSEKKKRNGMTWLRGITSN